MAAQSKRWHNLEVAEAIEELGSNERGLSSGEANRRLAQFGSNKLAEKEKSSPLLLLLKQFKDFLIIILLVAAIISVVLVVTGEGNIWDPILIVAIVLFAAILSFVQEYRSEKALEALKQMTAPTAAVLRDGQERRFRPRRW